MLEVLICARYRTARIWTRDLPTYDLLAYNRRQFDNINICNRFITFDVYNNDVNFTAILGRSVGKFVY